MNGSIPIPFPEFHKEVNKVAKSLYESGHFTDALRKACIKLEEECKIIYKEKTGIEKTWVPLFQQLFRYRDEQEILKIQERNSKKWEDDELEDESECLFPIVNLSTSDGVTKQKAFCNLYASVGEILRNTLAHSSDDLNQDEALYWLNIVSYLFYKLDRAKEFNSIEKIEERPEVQSNPFETKLTEALEKHMFENLVTKLLSDERIKNVPSQTQDKINARLEVKKLTEDILTHSVDEIGELAFNTYSVDPWNKMLIDYLINQLYDSKS